MASHIGELAALAVAFFWTITALAFEYAGNQVGSLAVNFIRLLFALLLLGIFNAFTRGMPVPADATGTEWFWLSLSGFVGFVMGDLFLFKSYGLIGARLSMLVMTTVPPITALVGWLMLSESMTLKSLAGMVLTFLGVALAVMSRKKSSEDKNSSVKFSIKGILFAFGGAIGQAVGLVLSKYGMGGYNAFSATQIRIITGLIGFSLLVIFLKRTKSVLHAFKHRNAMKGILIGAIFGPFLGVSLSLFSVQHTNTGIASTIMAIVPVLIIVPSVFVFKQKITRAEIIGAFISVAGVAVFFI
jgi:drug/metabolite transporter (DMT)-like permease